MKASFELVMPSNLEEAVQKLALSVETGDAMVLSGGTNIIPDMRKAHIQPQVLVCCSKLAELRGIVVVDRKIKIGASTTIADIEKSGILQQYAYGAVAQARSFAGQMVRNTATIGGNICCGSPASDIVPPLLLHDPLLTIQSIEGTREVPLEGFYLGYKKNVLRPGEILTHISWEIPNKPLVESTYKLGMRHGDAISVVSVSVGLSCINGRSDKVRIAFGAAAPTPIRAHSAEKELLGKVLSPNTIDCAARSVVADASPIDDVRATASYRAHCLEVITRRLLTQIWEKNQNRA